MSSPTLKKFGTVKPVSPPVAASTELFRALKFCPLAKPVRNADAAAAVADCPLPATPGVNGKPLTVNAGSPGRLLIRLSAYPAGNVLPNGQKPPLKTRPASTPNGL